HEFEQLGVFAEEVLPQIGAVLGLIGLEVAVDALFHPPLQQSTVIASKELVPVAAPDDFDHVPSRALEDALQFVDNASVAAHRAIQALQIAVDYEDQVLQLLARTQRDRAQRLDLIHLAVAQEGPDLTVGPLDQLSVLQVAHEARLIDGV